MVRGIEDYLASKQAAAGIIAMDIKNRGYEDGAINTLIYGIDYLKDDYELPMEPDYIIMNPPYATIEPFVMKALSQAEKGVLMLGRLQFLEGQSRYENILAEYPPSDVYVYVDRIRCYKNGEPEASTTSAQAYGWFWWDLQEEQTETKLHWIRRASKKNS